VIQDRILKPSRAAGPNNNRLPSMVVICVYRLWARFEAQTVNGKTIPTIIS